MKPRFSVNVNEGAFFYEPWLVDKSTGKDYRYDHIPLDIMRAFILEKKTRHKMDAHEARMIVDFALKKAGG